MKHYQRQFIQLILKKKILQFGDFTLKSGRKSPYFFNAGLFHSGEVLRQIGMFYAMAIQESEIPYDVLFGPAYKGIPLVCSTAIALARYNMEALFAFNRKERKTGGEGGQIVGAPLNQRVLLIDDVITAGTAIRESIELIHAEGGEITGIVVAFDRQEKGSGECSVIDELKMRHKIPVVSIITFNDVIHFMEKRPDFLAFKDKLLAYREIYGVDGGGVART
jgi:orotate phosphoribosyltransferase